MSYWPSEDVSQAGRLSAEFYTEDEVYRSAITRNWWEGGLEMENFEHMQQTREAICEFEQGGCAPAVPADIYFRFAETTIEVNDITADCLGNRLIDIFITEYTMHIIKTSLHKFSLKAESTNAAWFVFKVRIYSTAPSHIVEFQRRKGDSIAFHQFFRKVMGLLTKSIAMDEVGDFKPPHPIHKTASIQPFIDMANNTRDPLLLGEAVSGLNAVVKDQYVLELCTREAFTAFEAMLCVGGYNVLCPLAQLLSELTTEIKAMPLFATRKFWEALLEVVIGEETCEDLKTTFARVVVSALAFGATNEQIDVLWTARTAVGVSEQICQILDEAARMADLFWTP